MGAGYCRTKVRAVQALSANATALLEIYRKIAGRPDAVAHDVRSINMEYCMHRALVAKLRQRHL